MKTFAVRASAVLAAMILATLALSAAALASGVVGTGTPESCTTAALDTALRGGGNVTFNCGASPVTISYGTVIRGWHLRLASVLEATPQPPRVQQPRRKPGWCEADDSAIDGRTHRCLHRSEFPEVIVQLQRSDAPDCWEAVFMNPATRNTRWAFADTLR